jgi:hypothetical protein
MTRKPIKNMGDKWDDDNEAMVITDASGKVLYEAPDVKRARGSRLTETDEEEGVCNGTHG